MGRIMRVASSLLLGAHVICPAVAEEHRDDESSHSYHKDTFGVFLGFATEGSRDNGVAFGIEYEHRLSAAAGIGVVAERTFGDLEAWVFAAPVAYHDGPWKLYVGPGIERREGENEFLVRLGGEYGFHFGDWEISPQLDIDFVDDESVFVIGLTLLRGF